MKDQRLRPSSTSDDGRIESNVTAVYSRPAVSPRGEACRTRSVPSTSTTSSSVTGSGRPSRAVLGSNQ